MMAVHPLVDDVCTCPVCSSDLVDLVPCQRELSSVRGVPLAMGQADRGDCDPLLSAGSGAAGNPDDAEDRRDTFAEDKARTGIGGGGQ